ncbi:hypothetical protein BO94DRAFT_538533 [Aspergillus sclerotioniger CBS 115572]|uniref:Uncharacterized protein n=1 Tax=Aspergillus sclerotioniger CBS 115572 TaxID=1450535 RepID=A0A317VLI8_9EURO|nr:hypothetical protein BO94DRAFT_538533 [Aspergillus sclerotioniger CBS 115572]PWY75206.1 hypothetical protein BO94DRAFT_538533 [Aspergillus sclerotioniger CBS 115572]
MKSTGTEEDGFVFVNISRPDEIKSASTQRTIRRRVMREIGRARRTHARPLTWTLALKPPAEPGVESIPASLDPCNTTFYPTPLDDRGLQLMHFMTSDRDYVFRPFRAVWFSMALTDASAVLVALANAAMFLDQKQRVQAYRYETSAECLTYYGQCVQQVTRRLGDVRENLSEGIITTILGLICHDLYVGMLDRWNTHICGLGRIFQLRGGYKGLDDNVALFAGWLDVVGSVMEDSPPRLPRPPGFATLPPDVMSPDLSSLLNDIAPQYASFYEIATAFNHASFIIQSVEESLRHSAAFWRHENNLTVIELFGPATHFLLSVSRPSEAHCSEMGYHFLQEAIRLALLLLLAALKQDVFLFTSHESDHLRYKFSMLVPQLREADYDDSCGKLYLWALVTVLLLSHSTQPGLYMDDIRSVLDRLGITAIEGMNIVNNILSINILGAQATHLPPELVTSSCT